MKVKVLCRNPDDYLRETKRDIYKVPRNYNPALHPFEAPREYTRALNAVKLERVFAKPFVANLSGHRDGVSCVAKHPQKLAWLLSGACDGEVRIWDLTNRKSIRNFQAHEGHVRGSVVTPDGGTFLTVGDDKTIKFWKTENPEFGCEEEPTNTIISKLILTGISHHQNKPMFATCGEACQIWEETRNEPIRTLKWGADSLHCIRYNQVETTIIASCANDRSIILYDTREATPLRKITMELSSNTLCWNPMEAFIFTVANEDYNLYTFDMRKLQRPVNMHMDHVSAVLDVDYAPTGKEFVSGSYDKTVRIFPMDKSHSREVYHTQRMQRLSCVAWSMDNKYIISGSDEMNLRVWKSKAWEKLGVLKYREKSSLDYNDKLKEKFAHHPQVRRIARHRHVQKHVYNATQEHRIIRESQKRKEANRRAHSKPGSVPFTSRNQTVVISEKE